MPESMLLAAAAGVAAGALAVGVVILLRRIVVTSKDLGTDVEQATYQTLHLASRAAKHLRGGIAEGDAPRAGRHLRALLGCETLALVDAAGQVTIDGDDAVRALAGRLAAEARASGRAQLQRRTRIGDHETDAVAAPILAGGVPAGAIVAFAPRVRAGLVRATGEVADWVAAQVELGELDASRAALAEAEVRALRAQISPHFIYNSLNAIASFINTDPAKARELVLEFADFTRYSFRRHGDFTTVAEELRSIDSYLQLERARFGDRLKVTLQIAPEVLSTVVPFLSIQPLVENAVRHGLEGRGWRTHHDRGLRSRRVRRDQRRGRRRRHRSGRSRTRARRRRDRPARRPAQRGRSAAPGLRRRTRARRGDERGCRHHGADAGAEIAARPGRGIRSRLRSHLRCRPGADGSRSGAEGRRER